MAEKSSGNVEILKIQDIDLEVERRGAGPPLVLLDDEEGLTRESPVVDQLAKSF